MTAHGARPPKRVIRREVQDKLAEKLLDGTVVDGQTVQVDAGDGGLSVPRGGHGNGRCGVGGQPFGWTKILICKRRPGVISAFLRCAAGQKHNV